MPRRCTDPDPDLDPRALALRRLALREHGARELEGYLAKRGVASQVAAQVVRELVQEGLIDDVRYTRVVAREQALRGKGPRYIQAKMRRKGVQAELSLVRELYEQVAPENEFEMARKIVEQRYPDFSVDIKIRSRALRALLTRGFSLEVAKRAVKASR